MTKEITSMVIEKQKSDELKKLYELEFYIIEKTIIFIHTEFDVIRTSNFHYHTSPFCSSINIPVMTASHFEISGNFTSFFSFI